jgi:hypothetical protein
VLTAGCLSIFPPLFAIFSRMQGTTTWIEAPDDVLEAADALLLYVIHGRQRRCEHTSKRRPLYKGAMDRARVLLNVQLTMRPDEQGLKYWFVPKGWEERLKLAGVHPETLKVEDDRRWAYAWQQLIKYTFTNKEQRKMIALGLEVPAPVPITKTVATKRKGKPEEEPELEADTQWEPVHLERHLNGYDRPEPRQIGICRKPGQALRRAVT